MIYKTERAKLDNRAIKLAMAKDCIRVCADNSCKDPLRATKKAMCGCNSGDNELVRVDSVMLKQEVARASHKIESDSDVVIVDEDMLLEEINRARRGL
jgi:hypothetical protein